MKNLFYNILMGWLKYTIRKSSSADLMNSAFRIMSQPKTKLNTDTLHMIRDEMDRRG